MVTVRKCRVVKCQEPSDLNCGGWDVLCVDVDTNIARCIAELPTWATAVQFALQSAA